MVKDEWDILRAEAEALGYAGMQAKYGPSRARTGDSGERYIWIEERNTAVRYRLDQVNGWVYCGLWAGHPPHLEIDGYTGGHRKLYKSRATPPQEGSD